MLKQRNLFFIIIVLGALISACGGAATPGSSGDATGLPVVVDNFSVIAEGRLVPAESAQLAFVSGGRVAEILVAEGDLVSAGDVLARLGDREPFESAVAGAELDLALAELEKASAASDLLAAGQALQLVYDTWPDAATLAQQALKDARQRQYNAGRNLGFLTTSAEQTDIDLAYTQMVLAQDALENAQEAFEPWENKPPDNLTRAVLQANVAAAQQAYDDAVRLYNALTGTANEFDVTQAEFELAIAEAQLTQTQEDYDLLVQGPNPDDIALGEARLAVGAARQVAAELRIASAQANLAAARANLADLDLTATISGTVVELDLIPGEQVSPGVPVVQLADFSRWYVETDNLTEIEVVDVTAGQRVTVVPDALPDVRLSGTVESISDVFEEKRGDITYTAQILLGDIDPRLRWGMTVVVTFEE